MTFRIHVARDNAKAYPNIMLWMNSLDVIRIKKRKMRTD